MSTLFQFAIIVAWLGMTLWQIFGKQYHLLHILGWLILLTTTTTFVLIK